jgi:uncharacterized membrane protein YfcA
MIPGVFEWSIWKLICVAIGLIIGVRLGDHLHDLEQGMIRRGWW